MHECEHERRGDCRAQPAPVALPRAKQHSAKHQFLDDRCEQPGRDEARHDAADRKRFLDLNDLARCAEVTRDLDLSSAPCPQERESAKRRHSSGQVKGRGERDLRQFVPGNRHLEKVRAFPA